jgi:hypothetical protein
MVRHERFAEAQAEAMRLSQHERTKVHVLQLVGTAHPPQQVAIWEWRADQ